MARRGRPREPGKVYYLGRLRFRPGMDPPELAAFLERLAAAGPGRGELLKRALIGGLAKGGQVVGSAEDEETRAVLDELLGEF